MKEFEEWPLLQHYLEQGTLAFVDLFFAKSVLKRIDLEKEAPAAFLAVLFALSRQGHLALDISSVPSSLRLLGMEESAQLADQMLRGVIAVENSELFNTWIYRLGSYYYLQKNWLYETEILNSLRRLSQSTPFLSFSSSFIDPRLNSAQKKAVEFGMRNTLSFLTGGPGTGKTFTAAALVKACLDSLSVDQRKELRILLSAPTGKAVAQLEGNLKKALGEITNIRSGTLHAILGLKAHVHELEEAPLLFADLILIDECSMIDARIFSLLLKAVPSGARLILIGDKDQLPPVETGSIFADLLDSKMYPVTHLEECLRAERSEILNIAHLVKEGKATTALQLLAEKNEAVIWEDLKETRSALPQLWETCKDRFFSFYDQQPQPHDILPRLTRFSLLSCMRQGPLGVEAINRYFLYQSLNQVPPNAWWVAPIMVTRNDSELELYNGDLGCLIRKITPDFSLGQFSIHDEALFGDRAGGFRKISALALTAFEYCYCLSVHKSQGSEYDEVFILMSQGSELFGREILYTAITRARRKVTLAASKDLLHQTVTNSTRKISGLSARLKSTSAL